MVATTEVNMQVTMEVATLLAAVDGEMLRQVNDDDDQANTR